MRRFVARYWIELVWGLFTAANIAVIVVFPSLEAVAFHFVWTSLTLVYGIRLWRPRMTALALLGVCGLTGAALLWIVATAGAHLDEVAEVPLMAAMFVTVMWQVRRRQTAMEEVSRLAESERRLREREQNLVRDASHELRTPITVARGHAELLQRKVSGQKAEDVGVILRELDRLSRIADRLLILAASEHPDFLQRQPIDLGRLIVDTARRWDVSASREWQVAAPVVGMLAADEERLQSALDALVENAIKFTREGDRIAIVGRIEGTTALIEVSDTGDGIPAEYLPRIFDRFSRINGGRPRGNAGTGLGLAIVKAIVEAHGGTVDVRSEVGLGTTFSLRLPGFRPLASVKADELELDAQPCGADGAAAGTSPLVAKPLGLIEPTTAVPPS